MIKAPYLTQFLSSPRYAPIPQVAVASAGRVFKAYGHIAFKVREEHLLNTLAAYNGYNGTLLWKRDLTPGIMVHRNTMIATPQTLYFSDDKSCKLIDTATGELKDEIIPPVEVAGGTFWKWMALEDGILYALIGEDEYIDPVVRLRRTDHGWPWDPLSKGYNLPENPWGYGRNLLAIDPTSKEVLWDYHEDEPIDSRAVCMKNGQIYVFSFGSYLACINAKTGKPIWRKTRKENPELFRILGENLNRQDWRTNFRTTAYLKCSDKALYFAGPMMDKLIAVSTEDGSVMWHNPYDNYQLILRNDGLYGISGPWGNNFSRKFDPLTGQVLAEYDMGRRACTRPTGTTDAIFFRAMGGSVRFDLASERPQWMSPMRPPCHDGVTVTNGLLYWWASVCDCQLQLYGVTCLGPAGDFNFTPGATENERLEINAGDLNVPGGISVSQADWPTFRHDNKGSATTESVIPVSSELLWQYTSRSMFIPSAPIAVGGMVFLSGSDGIVRALDAATGDEKWVSYTGGGVRIPPTFWKGRVIAGSGDGWVYSMEAKTGRKLWRFRAAPAERKIPVYGALLSTWPTASGVLIEDGIAYVAAGIVNYDGTYVYALNAANGRIKWHNNTSGHLNPQARTGVSVQGHLLLHNGKLYMPGGTSVSPSVYDIADGKCLNNPENLDRCESISLRGWELYLTGDKVVACGQPYYKHPKYIVNDATSLQKMFHASTGDRDIIWQNSSKIMCYPPIDRDVLTASVEKREFPGNYVIPKWGKLDIPDKPLWEYNCEGSVGLALCKNAVVVATEKEVTALDIQNGSVIWQKPVPSPPVPWGLAVDSNGRVIVTLEGGQVMCFGKKG